MTEHNADKQGVRPGKTSQGEGYKLSEGDSPLILTLPHIGTRIPRDIAEDMVEAGREVPDTDWHLDQLWDFVPELEATVLAGRWSRYVVDLNRDPNDTPLYEEFETSPVCPVERFDGERIYRTAAEPTGQEIRQRVARYWQPWHAELLRQIARIKARHGYVVLIDGHSIRSRVPRLFEGRLPDINIGTAEGEAASPSLIRRVMNKLEGAKRHYAVVLDDRFKGGFITRHYGVPRANIHAIQIELSQVTYMDEDPPFAYREELAEDLRPYLRGLMESLRDWQPEEADQVAPGL